MGRLLVHVDIQLGLQIPEPKSLGSIFPKVTRLMRAPSRQRLSSTHIEKNIVPRKCFESVPLNHLQKESSNAGFEFASARTVIWKSQKKRYWESKNKAAIKKAAH